MECKKWGKNIVEILISEICTIGAISILSSYFPQTLVLKTNRTYDKGFA